MNDSTTMLWITPNPIFITSLASRRCYTVASFPELINELHEKGRTYQDRLLARVFRENALDVFEHVHAYFIVQCKVGCIPAFIESYLKVSPISDKDYLVSGNLRAFWNFCNLPSLWPKADLVRAFNYWLELKIPYLFQAEDKPKEVLEKVDPSFLRSISDNDVVKIWETDFDDIAMNCVNFGHSTMYDLNDDVKEKHCAMMIGISNFSRVASHQLVRHREFSYDQESLRFSSAHKECMIIPASILEQENIESLDFFISSVSDSVESFNVLRDHFKIPKEDARFVIPMGINTKLVMTGTISSFKHIIKMREGTNAQWEIRNFVNKVKELLPS